MNTTRSATWRAKFISWVTTSMVMPRAGEVAHHRQHLADQLGIQRAGDLVEQHRLGLHRQRAGDGDALLLAAGELLGIVVAACRRARPARSRAMRRARAPRARAAAARGAGASMTFSSAVMCGNRLKSWNTMPTWRADARRSRAAAADGRAAVAGSRRPARRRSGSPRLGHLEPVEAAQQRRLAGAGRADDADHLAAGDAQADALEHLERAERFVDVDRLDHRRRGSCAALGR